MDFSLNGSIVFDKKKIVKKGERVFINCNITSFVKVIKIYKTYKVKSLDTPLTRRYLRIKRFS